MHIDDRWLTTNRLRHPGIRYILSPTLHAGKRPDTIEEMENAAFEWLVEAQNDPSNLFFGDAEGQPSTQTEYDSPVHATSA